MDDRSDEMSGGPDWQGLLKWSLRHTDGTSSEPRRQITEEERRWFYEAVASQVEDEGERLKQNLLVLSQSHDGEIQGITIGRQIEVLEDLEDLVAQIDLAKTFVKLEGMGILLSVARRRGPGGEDESVSRLRAGALTAAAVCLRHNAEGQADFLARGGIEAMMEVVANDGETVKVRAKAVGAVSAAVRHNFKAFIQFLHAAGLDIILLALKTAADTADVAEASVPLLRKGFRLLEYVARESLQRFGKSVSQVTNACVANGPGLVLAALQSSDMEVREASLAFLSELVRHDPGRVGASVREAAGGELAAALREVGGMKEAENEDRLDEIEIARAILKDCAAAAGEGPG